MCSFRLTRQSREIAAEVYISFVSVHMVDHVIVRFEKLKIFTKASSVQQLCSSGQYKYSSLKVVNTVSFGGIDSYFNSPDYSP